MSGHEAEPDGEPTTLGDILERAGVFTDLTHPSRVRADMKEALAAWAAGKDTVGGFLSSLLCNDLVGACARADRGNLVTIPALAAYLWNEMPSPSWGSPAKVRAWAERHGLPVPETARLESAGPSALRRLIAATDAFLIPDPEGHLYGGAATYEQRSHEYKAARAEAERVLAGGS